MYGNAPLAQPVEHMTFNHGVRSSILRRSTNGIATAIPFFYLKICRRKRRIGD